MTSYKIVYEDPRDADDTFNILQSVYNMERISDDTLIVSSELKSSSLTIPLSGLIVPWASPIDLTTHRDVFERYGRVKSYEPYVLGKRIKYHTKDRSMYQQFYPSGLYSDKTIIINNVSFPVHRIILSSISDFFFNLFSEYETDVIELYDIDVDAFNLLMHFVYGYVLKPDGVNTLRMLSLAHSLLIRDLDPENIIIQLDISEPDFEEYIDILSLLYPGNISEDIIYHLYRTLGKNYWHLAPTRWQEKIKKLVTAGI